MTAANAERFVVRRTIAASAAEIFSVLSDPDRHQDTEPTDWVRGAVDAEPITAVGQLFAVNMFHEIAGGHYVVHSRVTEFDHDRRIAWMPGVLTEDGTHDAGGWIWRYELTPAGPATEVTLTYDWSGTPPVVRERVGTLPMFGESLLVESLAALANSIAASPSAGR